MSYPPFRISLNHVSSSSSSSSSSSGATVKVPTACQIEKDKHTIKYKDIYGRFYYWNINLDLPMSYYVDNGIYNKTALTFISKGLSGVKKVYNTVHAEVGEKLVLTKVKKKGDSVYNKAPKTLDVSVIQVVTQGSTTKQVAPIILNISTPESYSDWWSFFAGIQPF